MSRTITFNDLTAEEQAVIEKESKLRRLTKTENIVLFLIQEYQRYTKWEDGVHLLTRNLADRIDSKTDIPSILKKLDELEVTSDNLKKAETLRQHMRELKDMMKLVDWEMCMRRNERNDKARK